MDEIVSQTELFRGLSEAQVTRLLTIARPRSLRPGEYLFLLGDHADTLFVVRRGRIDLCFPFSFRGAMRDISFESKAPGTALGWSALVEPYRFTLSARAGEASEVVGFARHDLLTAFEAEPQIGYTFHRRLAEMIGHRLLNIQALWARELQRAVADGLGTRTISKSDGPLH